MREMVVWMLIALTLFLVIWFWVKPLTFPISSAKNAPIPSRGPYQWDWKAPILPPPPSSTQPPAKGEKKAVLPPINSDKDFKLYDAPVMPTPPEVPSPLPPTKYEKFKREVAEWGGILGKFSPLVTTVVAVAVKRRRKKRDKHGRK